MVQAGYYETVAGGAGAGPTWDGRSGVHTHMTNTRITDPEILERRLPLSLSITLEHVVLRIASFQVCRGSAEVRLAVGHWRKRQVSRWRRSCERNVVPQTLDAVRVDGTPSASSVRHARSQRAIEHLSHAITCKHKLMSSCALFQVANKENAD